MLGCITLFGSVRVSQAVTIDFDNLAFLDVVTTQYPEAAFSSQPGFVTEVGTPSGPFGTSAPNFVCSAPAGGGFPKCEHETIVDFTTPVNLLTFKSVGANSSGVIAQVDVHTPNQIDTVNIFGSQQLVNLSLYGNISKIRIHSINDHLGVGWDDFTFEPIPEPGTFALFGSALLLTRRRPSLQRTHPHAHAPR
jgi:hypothetical protein